jgi:Abortive infection alpha
LYGRAKKAEGKGLFYSSLPPVIKMIVSAMTENDSKSRDLLGIKPVGAAIFHVTKAAVDGASAFLGRICLPAAEEFGLLLQDKVRTWRARNAVAVLREAEARYQKYTGQLSRYAHPRLVADALQHGSWVDDKTLQEMWGGLLASSCSPDGKDDSNLIFINLLSQLTTIQVRILNHACEKVEKSVTPTGLITPDSVLLIDIPTIKTIAGHDDIHRLDRELDHLRGLGLIKGGFNSRIECVDITPNALALNLYVRCQGFGGSAVEFFKGG